MNAEQNCKIQAKKRAVNTFIYYICMLLCYFPVAVFTLIKVTYEQHWNIMIIISYCYTIMFMHSAINPFLYIWRNREIRRGVLKILRKILCKTDEENLNNGDQWSWWFICVFILRSRIHLRHYLPKNWHRGSFEETTLNICKTDGENLSSYELRLHFPAV